MTKQELRKQVNEEKINNIRRTIERFDFKVNRCIIDGLLSDNNELIADINIVRSSWRVGNKPPEVEEAEKLWGQYVAIKNKFELNCLCDKIHK
jgi:hypothetical protein